MQCVVYGGILPALFLLWRRLYPALCRVTVMLTLLYAKTCPLCAPVKVTSLKRMRLQKWCPKTVMLCAGLFGHVFLCVTP